MIEALSIVQSMEWFENILTPPPPLHQKKKKSRKIKGKLEVSLSEGVAKLLIDNEVGKIPVN